MSKWTKYKFDELYVMNSGISSSPEQAGHGFPFLSFKKVFHNYFLPQELSEKMDTSEKEREIYSIKKGDIFLTRTSETVTELGMSSVAIRDYPNATYSGFLKRLRPIQENVTYDKYMAFYLRSKFFRKTMTNNSIMTLRASLNEQIFSYLNLLLPEFETQRNIGELLHLMNDKIELNNKINAELEAMAKTLYNYWFVQFDFPNSEIKPYKASGGKMVYNEQLKREIPEGWEVKKVEDILSKGVKKHNINSIAYQTEGIIPIIDQSIDFIAGYTDATEAIVSVENGPKVVFGDHTRILKFINFDFARGADGTQVLESKFPNMPPHLFYQTLLNIDLSNYGYARHFKFLKDHKIVLPNEAVALEYDQLAKFWYEKIKLNRLQNQELAYQRDWLLPMLMNGQVTVKDAYIGVEEELGWVAEEETEKRKI